MSGDRDDKKVPTQSGTSSGSSEVADFLAKVAATPVVTSASGRGRLLFAMDATASREPTWDRACHLQAEMFHATDDLGGLEVQLVFYRGYGECKSTPWVSSSEELVRRMVKVRCLGGRTQIGKVLTHARRETAKKKVAAMVYVGDALEEPIDDLAAKAGELGLLGVRVFVFQEGRDPTVERGFREIARLTNGAYARFDSNAAGQLRDLLKAVAVYAAGGLKALADRGGAGGKLLLEQLR